MADLRIDLDACKTMTASPTTYVFRACRSTRQSRAKRVIARKSILGLPKGIQWLFDFAPAAAPAGRTAAAASAVVTHQQATALSMLLQDQPLEPAIRVHF